MSAGTQPIPPLPAYGQPRDKEVEQPSQVPISCASATDWVTVLTALGPSSPARAEALERLCRAYWHPLYIYVRSRGYDPQTAQDLTQSFFEHLLGTEALRAVDRSKGRFRSFLLVSLKNFLVNEWHRAGAQKRGGGCTILSLDATETWFAREVVTSASPDRLYDKRWALTVLEQALARLETEQKALGRGDQFKVLQGFLTGSEPMEGYAAVGAELGMTPAAVAMAVHRLRVNFRQLLQEEVAGTVSTPAQVEEELRSLIAALRED